MKLTTLRITLTAISILGFPAATHSSDSQSQTDAAWSELNASMDKMHMAMEAVKQSGDSDVDFVRLMLPHHQAAIDMAKSELLHGKDPQMLRLAQEIITDQQSEIQLMEQWLKARESVRSKENDKPNPGTEEGN
jgi:uncharacterized protein (DUF305 family)